MNLQFGVGPHSSLPCCVYVSYRLEITFQDHREKRLLRITNNASLTFLWPFFPFLTPYLPSLLFKVTASFILFRYVLLEKLKDATPNLWRADSGMS